MPCNGLPCIDCGAGIPKVQEGYATAGVNATSSSPWLLFACPMAEACVQKPGQRCRMGHTGELCNVCEDDFVFVDKLCESCTTVNSSPVLYLIVAVIAAMAVGVAYAKHLQRTQEVSSSSGLLHAQLTTDNPLQSDSYESMDTRQSLSKATAQRTDDAYMVVRVLYQPGRILVGYIQVVSQIGLVLDIKLPPKIQAVFGWLKPFAGFLTELFHLECLGTFSFYEKWVVKVFLIPLALLSIVTLHYLYVRHRGDATAVKNAAGSLRSNVFFILFLLYPGVCNQVFNIYSCRYLDVDHRVLRMDYSINCNDAGHTPYEIAAGVMIVGFSFGIPVGMGILMVLRMREYSSSGGTERFMARRVADELKITDVEAADAIRDVSTGREYSFLVNAFK